MTYAQWDRVADAVNPLLGVAVVGFALFVQRGHAWNFLVRAVVATALAQQSAKWIQHLGWLGPKFPSTHFAVALCLATLLALLHRRLAPVAAAIVVAYGILMLRQNYHTPLEMSGALYAIPLAVLAQKIGRPRAVTSVRRGTSES